MSSNDSTNKESSAPRSTYSKGFFNSSIISNTTISLPPRTVGGIRDQILKTKRCKCKKSNCLKLYCECFNSGIACSSLCNCVDCLNTAFKGENQKVDKRMEMIQVTLDRNEHAFRPKVSKITTSNRGDEATGLSTLGMPSVTADSHTKTSKMGCNCRKSLCLKKYCECFQASLYCMATCRCQNCQNKVGNEKREALMKKLKKKEEEKDNINLTTIAIAGTDHIDVSAMQDVGGVKAGTVAMVSAGVAAAGVDVFLPASQYARPMTDQDGALVSEIAFGVVGKQTVGGREHGNEDTPKIATNNHVGHSGYKTGSQIRPVANIKDIDSYGMSLKKALKELKDDEEGERIGQDVHSDAKLSSEEIAITAAEREESTQKEERSESLKRPYDYFARGTIDKIIKEVKVYRTKMDRIKENIPKSQQNKEQSNSDNSTMGKIVTDQTAICTDKIRPLVCKEEFPISIPKRETLNESTIPKIVKVAEQDIVLYSELSRSIMERALALAKSRKIRKI